MRSLLFLVLASLAALASALSSSGPRLLALFDDVAHKVDYSQFFGDLEGRGFQISYETPKSESLSLFHLGERAYDHVVFFPFKGKGLGPALTANLLLQFVNAKGNILLALSSAGHVPSALVALLAELDIQLPADRTGLVVDHFHYDVLSAADNHDVLVLPAPAPLRPDVKNLFSPSSGEDAVLAFPRGMAALLGPGELLTPVLRAPATAYLYNPAEQKEVVDDLFGAGAQLALVSAFQARNSARVAVVGSAEMLADKWFDAKVKPSSSSSSAKETPTWNREFAKRVAGWTFQEIGVLRVNWIEHRLNEVGPSNETNPTIYRVKNDVTYSASLSEYVWDAWTAFAVPANDALQLEFSMLSPFHRLTLAADPAAGTPSAAVYAASFRLPDQHGIFNFMLDYRRPLLTYLEEKRTVSVRHMAHDEWPRSFAISGAWPWIAGIGATVAGWVAFVAVWLYSAPPGEEARKRTAKKTQ